MICGFSYYQLRIEAHVGQVHTPSGVAYEFKTSMEDMAWPEHAEKEMKVAELPFLHVYHHITERDQTLYGFETAEARSVFVDLISVENMGCSKALKVMSSMAVEKLLAHIADGDVAELSQADGIGAKSAERIIGTLKEKYVKFTTNKDLGQLTQADQYRLGKFEVTNEVRQHMRDVIDTATLALVKLGYRKRDVEAVLKKDIPYDSFLRQQDPTSLGLDFNKILQTVIKLALPLLNAGDKK